MKSKTFFNLIGESFKDLFRKPLILLAGFALWAVLFLFSTLGGTVAGKFQTTFSNIVWTVVFGLVAIGIMSFIFSGMIGLINKKRNFFENGRRFWKGNFIILLIILVVTVIVGRIADYGADFIGLMFGLSVNSALIFFILIYFIGLVGVLIFLTYASFFLVLENLNVVESLKKSKRFVMKNYLSTLSVLVGLFVVGYLLNRIPSIAGDLIEYVLYLPLVVLILGKMVLYSGRK